MIILQGCKYAPLTLAMKRSPLRPSLKPMKRTRLKMQSKKTAKKNRDYRSKLDIGLTTCWMKCGRLAIHRHHLYPQGTHIFLASEPLNLIPLCSSCHAKAHENLEAFRDLVRSSEPYRMIELDRLAKEMGKDNQLRRLRDVRDVL